MFCRCCCLFVFVSNGFVSIFCRVNAFELSILFVHNRLVIAPNEQNDIVLFINIHLFFPLKFHIIDVCIPECCELLLQLVSYVCNLILVNYIQERNKLQLSQCTFERNNNVLDVIMGLTMCLKARQRLQDGNFWFSFHVLFHVQSHSLVKSILDFILFFLCEILVLCVTMIEHIRSHYRHVAIIFQHIYNDLFLRLFAHNTTLRIYAMKIIFISLKEDAIPYNSFNSLA